MPANHPAADKGDDRWPAMMSAATLATYLDLAERTVWKLAASGGLPRPLKLGGSSRWRRADVDAHLAPSDAD